MRYPSAVTKLGVTASRIDKFVRRLRRADAVKADLLVLVELLESLTFDRRGEARIEEAPVADPGNAGKLGPLDLVVQDLAGAGIEHTYDPPVGPAVLH